MDFTAKDFALGVIGDAMLVAGDFVTACEGEKL